MLPAIRAAGPATDVAAQRVAQLVERLDAVQLVLLGVGEQALDAHGLFAGGAVADEGVVVGLAEGRIVVFGFDDVFEVEELGWLVDGFF